MFEIKLEPMKRFVHNIASGIEEVIIHTQTWVKDGREYIIVHQGGLYNVYYRPLPNISGDWHDLLPQPVHDLLSIRCAIEELGIMPEEEVL
jgi:hypothetical protein